MKEYCSIELALGGPLEVRAEELPAALSHLGKACSLVSGHAAPCTVASPPLPWSQHSRSFLLLLVREKEPFGIFQPLGSVFPCLPPLSPRRALWESRPLCRRWWERPQPHLSPVTNQWQPSESWPPGSLLGPALDQWEASLADKGLLAALTCCLKSN